MTFFSWSRLFLNVFRFTFVYWRNRILPFVVNSFVDVPLFKNNSNDNNRLLVDKQVDNNGNDHDPPRFLNNFFIDNLSLSAENLYRT